MKSVKQESKKQKSGRQSYESPAIIHESLISTRAGSPLGNPSPSDSDPANLFGN